MVLTIFVIYPFEWASLSIFSSFVNPSKTIQVKITRENKNQIADDQNSHRKI